MSVQKPIRRLTAPDIAGRKSGEPVVSLTAYHAHTAGIADKYCDFLLVGDSLGMVMHGFETTVPVPLELMIMHGKAGGAGGRSARLWWSTCRLAPMRKARQLPSETRPGS